MQTQRYTIVKGGKASFSYNKMTTEQTTDEKSLQSINNAFKFYDFNSDGVIDKAELQRYFKSDKMVDGIVERLDKNKDGVISYSEFYSEISKLKDGDATLLKYLERFPLASASLTTAPDPGKPAKFITLQNNQVPMTWSSMYARVVVREGGEETREWRGEYEESDGGEKRRREEEEELMLDARVDEAAIEKVMKFGPFVDWMAGINRIHNADTARPELIVDKVHIQQIDMFGPKIGFLKFEVAARKWNEKMSQVAFVPGIVFMRGGAVGILCILIEVETGHEYALITLQPRIPAGFADFAEIPAGMLDGEPNNQKFAGKAAKEMNEETLLEIKETELYDLTALAFGNRFQGMYPSAGGCDEFLKLYLYRRYMSKETLQLFRTAHAGDDASEVIKLKLVPLDELWRVAPDAKALSALYLYEKFQKLKINHPPTPQNKAQEEQLKALLKPKVQNKQSKESASTSTTKK